MLRTCIAVVGLAIASQAAGQSPTAQETPQPAANAVVEAVDDLGAIRDALTSPLARQFVDSAECLPKRAPMTVHYRRSDRIAIDATAFDLLGEADREGYEPLELDERYYYFTRYGSPLHYAHTLDLIAGIGLESANGARLVDLGFGGIGQLRMLASMGAHVTGIEVDAVTELLYSRPDDTGAIEPCGDGPPGQLDLVYGLFPGEVAARVPGELDLLLSRNTLKRGYIKPKRAFRDSMDPLIDLGVSDGVFCRAVFERLKPGGLFVVYNLNPIEVAEGEEGWVPWSDGRFPFERSLVEQVGFEVVHWNEPDPAGVDWLARISGNDLEETRSSTWAVWTALRKPAD